MGYTRRDFLKAASASAALGTVGGLTGCASMQSSGPKVVVVGAGFGGATAAKYIRKWSDGKVGVTLVERGSEFISCPMSNLVLAGTRQLADLTLPYNGLDKWGLRRVRDDAITIDPVTRTVKLASGATLIYDRLILSPGIDFMWDQVPSLNNAQAQSTVLHAWKAGPQTAALRKQLEGMSDGGVFVMHIPKSPYRCPPGPYERACQVAHYFLTQKKKSKVIILDANEDVQSKKGLFTAAWNGKYKGYVEYRPNSGLMDVDVKTLTAKLEFDSVKADVLNVIPPQHAGAISRQLGMANANARFCQVDFLTYESTAQRNIHILGDSIQIAALMPKSGHMANQHAKVCAAAVVALLIEQEVNPAPVIANTCYSYIDDKQVVHVSSVHKYDSEKKTMVVVPGSGGLSPAPSAQEGIIAEAWAQNIWADMLT